VRAVVTLAAPHSDGPLPAWGWVLFGVFGALGAIALILSFVEGVRGRKVPVGTQERKFTEDLRAAPVDKRGYVRLSRGRYPSLTEAEAERLAAESGFYRQKFGTKAGAWLFRPERDRAEHGTLVPGADTAPVGARGDGVSSRPRNTEGRIMGGTLLLLAGVAAALAHITNWLNGNMIEFIELGDGPSLLATHVVNILVLAWGIRITFTPPKRKLRSVRH
jgi:hypothetical protein